MSSVVERVQAYTGDAKRKHLPQFALVYVALGVVALIAAFGAGLQSHDRIITKTQRIIRSPYQNPDQSVPAAQVSPALAQAGLTVCDVYNAKRTVVCH